MFLASKKEYCVTTNKNGVTDEQNIFKGFTKVSDNLARKEYCKMYGADKLIAKEPWSWRKSFNMGVVVPHKLRNCNKCTKALLCDGCDRLEN